MVPPTIPYPAHDGNHCLHYQEGDGNCCDCLKPLAHCHECGWAGEQTAAPAADHNLCPTCGSFLCLSFDDCDDTDRKLAKAGSASI